MKIFFLCFFAALACQVFSLSIVTTSPSTDEDPVISSIDEALSDLKKLNDNVTNNNVSSNKVKSLIYRVMGSLQEIVDPKNIVHDEVPSTRSVKLSPFNATHQNKSLIKKTTFADEERKAMEHRDTSANPKNFIIKNNYQVHFEPEEEATLSPPAVKNNFNSYSKELHDINHPLVRNYIEGIKETVRPKKTLKPLPKYTVEFIKSRHPVTERSRDFDSYAYDQADRTDTADRIVTANRAGANAAHQADQYDQLSQYIKKLSWLKNQIDLLEKGFFLDATFDQEIPEKYFRFFNPQQQQYLQELRLLDQQEMQLPRDDDF
ncbi:uncharacterized protein LOC123261627 [Cotesia glomerata]|uniref:Uncharacterized protein n=1 Tax=Cotesia glomerata TaxID=32391 RepID=A0AAV7IAS1_COTGL|nr:uncharacterized protein LOC123261627 [Cotesia glomerata]KAH0548834.1 hypothetical protein KQX54_003035 [Cotesia glomerata]